MPKDFLKPLTVTDFGSEADPCFAKLHDPRNEICSRCGDSEFCAIAMAQNTHLKRERVESKGKFKDIEEEGIMLKRKFDKKILKKEMRARIKEMMKGGKGASEIEIVNSIFAAYSIDGFDQDKIKKILKRFLDKNKGKFTKKQNHYKWITQ